MQKTIQSKIISTCLKLLVAISIAGASPVHSAFLYKSYIVRQDRGYDILCDPYVVKRNDYVLKLFRQKGEIAHTDFPEFLSVFKRINPHIRDINRIRPNQQIFIPLKKLKPGALPGQSSGIVTIPFVTISNRVERISAFSTPYQVQSGDCVSILIARRYGSYGSRSYLEGLTLFKLANPDITDIHRIYQGQRIVLPNPDIKRQPWYPSVLNGPQAATESPIEPDSPVFPTASAVVGVSAAIDSPPPRESALADVAGALGAELKNRGRYYFPDSRKEDVELDLSEFPVMAFNGQTFIFETGGRSLDPPHRQAVEAHWKNVKILSIPQETSSEQILESVLEPGDPEKTKVSEIAFKDNDVAAIVRAQWITSANPDRSGTKNRTCITMIEDASQKTPDAIRMYLAQHGIIIKELLQSRSGRPAASIPAVNAVSTPMDLTGVSDLPAFVSRLATAIGCRYMPNVSITFPYAGIQVRAVSNLIMADNGKELLVDFGDLYGDAVECIKRTGFHIMQIQKPVSFHVLIDDLLRELGVSYQRNPVFRAARRTGPYNTMLTIPGFLIEKQENSKILITVAALHDRLLQFIAERQIEIVKIEPTE